MEPPTKLLIQLLNQNITCENSCHFLREVYNFVSIMCGEIYELKGRT